MKLSAGQHPQIKRDEYLFFPGRFSAQETQNLTNAVL